MASLLHCETSKTYPKAVPVCQGREFGSRIALGRLGRRPEWDVEATMAIPMDQRDGWIWFDGELKPWKDAKVHVLTHGLHYASCVFEGERAYGGEIFRGRDHTERLINSGKILDFTIPYSADEIDAAKRLVLD